MFIQKENFGSEIEFRCRMHNSNYNFGTHIHQYAELMYVCEGEIEITVNGIPETASAGQFALIFPLQTHSYRTPVHSRVWNSVFSGALLYDFLDKHRSAAGGGAVFSVSGDSAQFFRRTLIEGTADGRLPNLFLIKACLYAVAADYPQTPAHSRSTRESEFVSAVFAYLDGHFRENIRLGDLADALGYSANYLSHRLRRSFGMNFCTLLNCFRLEHAKALLRTEAMTVLEIALECGYENERSFYRAFRQGIGITPGEYRSARRPRPVP